MGCCEARHGGGGAWSGERSRGCGLECLVARRRALGHYQLLALLEPEAVYWQLGHEGERVWWVSGFDFIVEEGYV